MSGSWFGSRVRLAAALLMLSASSGVHALDLASLGEQDLRALQQRLQDAKCYAGPVNGTRSTALDEALKRCPSMEPVLAIETGMHVAMINRTGIDRTCRLLVTASDDKTARLWSLPDSRLLHTLRLPVGPGHGGKVFAAALSNDGRTVAAGGWDAQWESSGKHGISLFDAASGELTARVGVLDNVVLHLAFSADNRYLAAVLGAGQGLRVLEVSTGREVAADRTMAPTATTWSSRQTAGCSRPRSTVRCGPMTATSA